MFCKLFCVLLLIVVSLKIAQTDFLGCRDENNNIVDWYYLYKLPSSLTKAQRRTQQKNDGHQFIFTTATQSNNTWTRSVKTIDNPATIPGYTLSQIYDKNFEDVALLYNDEPPEGSTDGSRGHTKGVFAVNTQQGFWLIHSVPHFPNSVENGTYSYPSTGKIYGQSFLCITIGAYEADKIGSQLLYNEPHIYSAKFPDAYKTLFPNLNRAANMESIKMAPFWSLNQISSINGVKFKSFAKTRHFQKELYQDWVAPTLSSDLMVESWLHGPGKIVSDCSNKNKVYNVKKVAIKNLHLAFSSMEDHSKWAVSRTNDWICVGDINREEHQKQRGGGTVCQQSAEVSTIYKNAVQDFEPCPRTTAKKRKS